MNKYTTILTGIMSGVLFFCFSQAVKAEEVTIFAAASLAPAMEELSQLYLENTGNKCRCTYASSSLLAKQIYNGAPADIYISANPLWMDYLAKFDALELGSRKNLLENSLVIVAPADSTLPIGKPANTALITKEGKFAIGDPEHVPAGIYAKEALLNLDFWKDLKSDLIRTHDARATLALIRRGEVAAGIVYVSDTYSPNGKQRNTKLLYEIPSALHAPIIYPTSIVKDRDRPEVKAYYKFLNGPEAQTLFNKYGFTSITHISSQ